MPRILLAIVAIFCSTTASAQIIYAPPEPPYYSPYEPDPWALAMIYSLNWPHPNVIVNVNTPNAYTPNTASNAPTYPAPIRQGPITIIPAGQSISPEAAGIDPQTGQPLFFRKRDLLPPDTVEPQASPPPAAQPKTSFPNFPQPAQPGQIIIKPWRPAGEKLTNR